MKESLKIAVVLFAFKRPRHLRKAIKTHKKIEGLKYFAFIDYSEMQKKIYEIIDEANIYDVIFKRPESIGLNESIKRGIQHIFNLGYDAVIVLEDDLLLADDAMEFLKFSLEMYHPLVFSVSCHKGLPLDPRFRCWAWGIHRSNWDSIDWSVKPKEKNRDSWDVIVNEFMRQSGKVCYCSDKQRVKHIGWNGTHYNLIGYLKEKL